MPRSDRPRSSSATSSSGLALHCRREAIAQEEVVAARRTETSSGPGCLGDGEGEALGEAEALALRRPGRRPAGRSSGTARRAARPGAGRRSGAGRPRTGPAGHPTEPAITSRSSAATPGPVPATSTRAFAASQAGCARRPGAGRRRGHDHRNIGGRQPGVGRIELATGRRHDRRRLGSEIPAPLRHWRTARPSRDGRGGPSTRGSARHGRCRHRPGRRRPASAAGPSRIDRDRRSR